ncbi:EAL domain-containing protein [Gimesia sp.]|uniref:two-component system response regulator n=1 Tax=Gimesia sp. TaxID=2024833 RepID=UPI003A8DEFD7
MHDIMESRNRRILVIDDNESIHADFRKILNHTDNRPSFSNSYTALFGEEPESGNNEFSFEVDSASQGKEGLEKVQRSLQNQQPYAMAFVDIRMPPGWDGIETVKHLWEVDPDLLIVLCTAFNDYNWNEMSHELGSMDRWLILKKPFESIEIRQLAASLTEKWDLARKAELKVKDLQSTIGTTNRKLEAFRKAVDSAGIVAVLDLQGTILEANDNFCRLSGYSREELVGQNHDLVLSEHHPPEFFDELYLTIEQNRIWRGEICNRAKDGSLYWVDTTIVPMLDEHDKTESYFTLRIEISERKRLLGQLRTQAYHDALTGLPNRAAILDDIQQAIDRSDQHKFALLFLDFDRFKLINDSLGHDKGDELLQLIARRLCTTLRATDQIKPARLGGDEFVILLNGLASYSDATRVAERLLETFSQSYQLGSHTVYSSASIGIVTSDYAYQSALEILRDADLAMYKAKESGQGAYVVFDQTMREQVQVRMQVESDLRNAGSENEFALFYQPIVSLDSGKMVGVEALIRWEHTEYGLINPDDFIPVAEETGMINSIGSWVLEESCRQFAHWTNTFGPAAPAFIHVNISRKQLLDPEFCTFVEQITGKYAIPVGCLHLEVTESLIMQDRLLIIDSLRKLKSMGVKIDMDDFGTGYSSLACLHELPLDVLKIDRTLILNVKEARDYAALMHAVLVLADNLQLKVVAEGIETHDQLILLQALGCEYGQGFLFSRPCPADELQRFFGDQPDWNKQFLPLPVSAFMN